MNMKLELPPDYDIINNISNAVIVTDLQGKILFMNAMALRLRPLHKPPLEVDRMILECVQKKWKDIVENIINTVGTSKVPESFEAEYVIEGKRSFFDVLCCAIPRQGLGNRLMFEFKDITLQKIYQEKTRSIAHDMTNLIETINAVVIGIDARGFIVAWNNCAEELTGFSQADALARHFTELFTDGMSQDILFGIISEAMMGKTVSNRELPLLTKKSKRLNLLINATSRKNADMEIVGIMVIGLDITELTEYKHSLEKKVLDRTEALERALEKEKELVEVKKRFVSIASHEFRTPISVIRLQTEALKKLVNHTHQADVTARLSRIHDQAEHMSVLLEDVLLIGKSDSGKIGVNIEPIELRSLLMTIISDIENTAGKSHRVSFTCPGNELHINSDKSLLRNIFVNLLSNAIKFSPGRDVVYFTVDRQGEQIEFTISDDGIGIPESDIDKIFQPFNRGANARAIKGTGLGISIVKKAVEALGGRVWVESKLNVGTRFTVQLKFNN